MLEIMRRIEAPTLLLTIAVYLAWLGLTFAAGRGAVSAFPLLVVVLTLHTSLQHEHIHGHPTPSERVNSGLAGWPLSLWLPYSIYRRTHREHHASEALTDPRYDAESFYVEGARFARMSAPRRAWRTGLQTLIGRLLLGPATMIVTTVASEARRWRRLDGRSRREELGGLLAHAAGVALVMLWLVGICELSPWLYAAAAVYPALSLTLLRSYAEHRPHPDATKRTNVVESRLGWLYLHNNLHVVHHDHPGLPWYALPRRWQLERARHEADGVRIYRGYRALLPFLVTAKDAPVHPASRGSTTPDPHIVGASP